MDEHDQADRREAAQAVERALSVLFGRARSFSLQVAKQVHPGLDTASYALLVHMYETGPVRAAEFRKADRPDRGRRAADDDDRQSRYAPRFHRRT